MDPTGNDGVLASEVLLELREGLLASSFSANAIDELIAAHVSAPRTASLSAWAARNNTG